MITIDHWVYPGWQADQGGWKRAGMVNDWLRNAKYVVDRMSTTTRSGSRSTSRSRTTCDEIEIGG